MVLPYPCQEDMIHAYIQTDGMRADPIGNEQISREGLDIAGQIDLFEVLGLIQMLVHESHRFHTALAVLENGENCRVIDVCRLKTEQRGDDLQIVLHTVIDLFQQHLFFFQRRLDQILCLLAVAANSAMCRWCSSTKREGNNTSSG